MQPPERSRKQRTTFSWGYVLFPVLVSLLAVVVLAIDTLDKSHIPFWWRGRNGLTLWETLWDANVFWGELWFNLALIMVSTAFVLFKLGQGTCIGWKVSVQGERKATLVSGSVALGLLIAMGVTWTEPFPLGEPWYTTQYAYQVLAWPAMLGFMMLVLLPAKAATSEQKQAGDALGHLPAALPWMFLGSFAGILTWTALMTEFHPHAIFGFEMQLYTIVMTVAFPCCGLGLASSMLTRERKVEKTQAAKMPWHRAAGACTFVMGLLLPCVVQVLGMEAVPLVGQDEAFSFDINVVQTWPLSHAPGWAFVIATVIFIVFGTRMASRRAREDDRCTLLAGKIHLDGARARALVKVVAVAALITAPVLSFLIPLDHQWNSRPVPVLLVNQVGYEPSMAKRVVYQSAGVFDPVPPNATFRVHDAASGGIIFEGMMTEIALDRYGYNYMAGEFTSVNETGRYYATATVNGRDHESYPFDIGTGVYDEAIEYAMRFYYYQRCNCKVEPVIPGYEGHEACHMNDAEVWNGTGWTYKNLTGGWHDAGDYNKYNSWFQTQWYCVHSLAECWLLDSSNGGFYSGLDSLVGTGLPDIIEEALWGAMYLLHCVNVEGYQGEENRYRVFSTVSGYRHDSDKDGRMSYWGPPEYDWTTPRRVIDAEGSFLGHERAIAIAGTFMQVARMIDTYVAANPGVAFPGWAPANSTYLREIASHVFDKYYAPGIEDDFQTCIGLYFFLEEKALFDANNFNPATANFSACDALFFNHMLGKIPAMESYPLWFGWQHYYGLGNILTHYIAYNRTIPVPVMDKINDIQASHFSDLFDEPFRVKHGRLGNLVDFTDVLKLDDAGITGRVDEIRAGQNILFFGAERQTDMLTSAWLQALCSVASPSTARLDLVQSMLDWLMGVNPAAVCMIEGVGSQNMRQYHHRYSHAKNPTGAVPGAIPNGLAPIRASKDYARARGFIANESNFLAVLGDKCMLPDWPANPMYRDGVPSNPSEVWIPHNAMFLRIFNAMSLLST